MMLTTKPPGFSAEGFHIARLFSFVEYGTIYIISKWQHQVRLTFELPYDLRVFKPGEDQRPAQISKDYASALYNKSHLKRNLLTWKGPELLQQLDTKFDPLLILGHPCQIKIEHHRNNAGNWYQDITEIYPVRDNDCPPQFNPNRIFTIENFDKALFDKMPDYVAQKIMRSKEFEKLNLDKKLDSNPFN